MTSDNPNNTVIEIDKICFETLLPEQNYQLPKYGEETPIQLGFRITNNSSTPYRFDLPQFEPEISTSNGEEIKMSWGRNATTIPRNYHVPFINSGESLEFYFYNPIFFWLKNRKTGFRGYSNYGDIWVFRELKPGIYNIRIRYKKTRSVKEVKLGLDSIEKYDAVWVGEVFSPWKKLYLR